jgi:beta-glucosidase
MSAYNRLNGTHCSEHEWLLTAVLRDEWSWDGLVVSDWYGTHSTADATNAGLDVEMPGPPAHRGEKLLAALAAGEVDEQTIDAHVRRVLVAAERTGALDAAGGDDERADDGPERRAVLRQAAAASVVLLKNESVRVAPVLPLDVASLTSIAVIGPNADVAMTQGGGSCHVWPHHEVSPLAGLIARVPASVDVQYEPGATVARTSAPRVPIRQLRAADGSPGYTIEYFQPGGGEPALEATSARDYFRWAGRFAPEVDPEAWWARVTTTFVPDDDGDHLLELRGAGRMRLFAGGDLVADGWDENGRQRAGATVALAAGTPVELVMEYEPPAGGSGAAIELRCRPPARDDLQSRAVAAARRADVAVVVVGTGPDWETEGRDRDTMDLPGDQDDLVSAILAANPRTVVVVNSGAPVTMPWADDAPAIVQCWFAGQELGHGLADVLVGDVNPSGRLPTTIPLRIEDTPAYTNYPGELGHVLYGEGVFVGYRWYDARDLPVRFAFGHGLSYTTFGYGPLTAVDTGDAVTATVQVTNTGTRAGAEVVQLYVRDVEAAVARPPKELRAFATVHLEPGEGRDLTFSLDDRAFAYWDAGARQWRVEPGVFELLVGASSADIRAHTSLTKK